MSGWMQRWEREEADAARRKAERAAKARAAREAILATSARDMPPGRLAALAREALGQERERKAERLAARKVARRAITRRDDLAEDGDPRAGRATPQEHTLGRIGARVVHTGSLGQGMSGAAAFRATAERSIVTELYERGDLTVAHIMAADRFVRVVAARFGRVRHGVARYDDTPTAPVSADVGPDLDAAAHWTALKAALLPRHYRVLDAVLRHGESLSGAARLSFEGTPGEKRGRYWAERCLIDGLDLLVRLWGF